MPVQGWRKCDLRMPMIPGLKYLDKCPQQPRIPTYLFVGGAILGVSLLHLLWRTKLLRKLEQEDDLLDFTNSRSRTPVNSAESRELSRFLDCMLTVAGCTWFMLGNYWVFSIWTVVNYERPMLNPTEWCHQFLFVFAFSQIFSIHCLAFLIIILIFLLFSMYIRIKLSQ